MPNNEKYLMGNENVFVGNITKNGIKQLGKIRVFDVTMYNGKDTDPFFVQVKVFSNTSVDAKLSAKSRVRVYGSLRLNKWGEDKQRQTIIVNANKIESAPWKGGDDKKELPVLVDSNPPMGFDEDETLQF